MCSYGLGYSGFTPVSHFEKSVESCRKLLELLFIKYNYTITLLLKQRSLFKIFSTLCFWLSEPSLYTFPFLPEFYSSFHPQSVFVSCVVNVRTSVFFFFFCPPPSFLGMGRYKDHSRFRGSNRKQNSPQMQRGKSEGWREREGMHLYLMWGLSKASWESKPTTNDLMLRPLVNLKACLFEESAIFLLFFSSTFFSPHIEFSNYTVVAKMIGTRVIKRWNCTSCEIPLEMNVLVKYSILAIYRGMVCWKRCSPFCKSSRSGNSCCW